MFIAHWEFDVMISYAWLPYSFGTLTCWWHWLILFIILAYWFCSCHDYPAHLGMYVHIALYLVCLSVDSLACILSWLSWIMLSLIYIHLNYHTSCLACVWYIPVLHDCFVPDCSSSVWLHALFTYVGHISILLAPTLWFWSFPSFRLLFLQVWGLVCVCTLTEIEVKSRV